MEEDPIDIKEFDRLPQFIAVEGPIGAGKTTLTNLLADSLNYETFLEQPSENPFLPDFYINPSQAALATQLFFLFQRVKQIQELKQADIFLNKRVSDFLLDKDKLFAKATLSSEELKLYEQIYQYLAIDLPTPDFPDIPIMLPFLIFKFSTFNLNFSFPGYENFIFLSSMDLLNLTNSLLSFFEKFFLYKNEFLKSKGFFLTRRIFFFKKSLVIKSLKN